MSKFKIKLVVIIKIRVTIILGILTIAMFSNIKNGINDNRNINNNNNNNNNRSNSNNNNNNNSNNNNKIDNIMNIKTIEA